MMTVVSVYAALTIGAVLVLLYAEKRQLGVLRWIAKPIAAIGFVLDAHSRGALDSEYGRAIFAALLFSFAGDILLIPKSKSVFKAGVLAFMGAHVCYLFAFRRLDLTLSHALFAYVVLVPIAIAVLRQIFKNIPASLRLPVLMYIGLLSTMVAFAIATGDLTIICAAVLFYFSDLCVARERFLDKSFINKLFGLPLYFGAQLVFAATIGR